MAFAEEAIKVFISYSRTDSQFVDRLEASLRARGFGTWVDRQRLEGGQDWLDTIQHAIAGCQRLVVVLSPTAVDSEFVRMEYRYARHIGKPLIPALLISCPNVPMDLPMIQWVDFQGDYEDGIKHLMIALMREATLLNNEMVETVPAGSSESVALVATPANPIAELPETPLRELYIAGLAARARNDLERTAVYWDQILERDPTYLDGIVAVEMEAIRLQLLPIRLQRLRELADAARLRGEWAQEIASWQVVLSLEPDDMDAQAQLTIAKQNRANEEQYDIAREMATKDDKETARYQLKLLWSRAKYYGDPAGIAGGLGIPVPPSYREVINKAQFGRYRSDFFNLSLGLMLLYVFVDIFGMAIVADFITNRVIVVGVAAAFFALLCFAFGIRRGLHPVAFTLVVLLAIGVSSGVMQFIWPTQSDPTTILGKLTELGDQRAVYTLPFFYYSDPLTGQRYYSNIDPSSEIYREVPNASVLTLEYQPLQLGNADSFCGDLSFINLGYYCIFTNQPGNPSAVWNYCATDPTESCSDPGSIAGTTDSIYRAFLANSDTQGTLTGFALSIVLPWAVLGVFVGAGVLMVRYRRLRLRRRRPMSLPQILARLALSAIVGAMAGFVHATAIYFLGWPVSGFIYAAAFTAIALIAAFHWPSSTRIVGVLVACGVLLVGSLALWSLLLHVAGLLLFSWAAASVLGSLWALSMVETVRMCVTRPT